MTAHATEEKRESAESFILRAGEFEQLGSSIDEYAVLIEGLRAHYDNYELYFMLGLYYRYRNADQAYLCFENALHFCDEPEDEKVIRKALEDISDRSNVRGTSIVIVSYNDYELLRECLRAIRRYCPENGYEVILVDNASTDDAVLRLLKEQADSDSHIKLKINDKNEGFSAGCNEGLELSNPENDVFFLNNDAVLMPNALFWLKMGLYADKRNGAAGAVTNCAPSQEVSMESVQPYLAASAVEGARPLVDFSANVIDAKGKWNGSSRLKDIADSINSEALPSEHRWWRTISLDSALETAKRYAKDHNVPMWNPTEVRCRLTGFAVLLRREAVNNLLIKAGDSAGEKKLLFDERFSPAYFEDDDLGIRLCLAGWRQVLCHNAFIYHHGGSGFSEKKDAMEYSREKFMEKWGFDIWNYTLPEDDKIAALMDAIAQSDSGANNSSNKNATDFINNSDTAKDNKKKTDNAQRPEIRLRLYNRVLRILDLEAGMGTTLSAIKYQMPDSFTAGITKVDVFAGLSRFMADDMISGDPEIVTFPWPLHSFDYILAGGAVAGAQNPEKLLEKLGKYLANNGRIL
ncbi:glycosyltransferase family 2 protein [Butyrivibrio sp. LC3010]|uniref:glycosyltransferase family 2 protein n=1 Tax=Butyrivibrio sp. LC3010 TaxID=1280680 RepID=UPI000418164E|nr:glycosyltransferase family 2 protein [Butyrivibrio sp. LC3010]